MSLEKKLGLVLLVVILLGALSFLFPPVMAVVHGVIQLVFGGTSLGKTYFVLAWFGVNVIISLVVLRLGWLRRFKVKTEALMALFFLLAALGLLAGYWQFSVIAQDFGARGPFTAVWVEEGVFAMEQSVLGHNHFTKPAMHYAGRLAGVAFPPSLDDGRPFYEALTGWENLYLLYITLFGFLLLLSLLIINRLVWEVGLSSYLAWLAGSLSLLVLLIDGGMFSVYFLVALWFFLFFFAQERSREASLSKALVPLAGVGLYAYIAGHVNFEDFVYSSGWAMLLAFSALYLIQNSLKLYWGRKKMQAGLGGLLALVLLALSFNPLLASSSDYAFGETVFRGEEAGLYVYGLPAGAGEEAFLSVLEEYGQVRQGGKMAWTAFAVITPNETFSLRSLEERLKHEFQPQGYLIVRYFRPEQRQIHARVQWLDGKPEIAFENASFLDLEVVRVEEDGETTLVVFEGWSLPEQQLISLSAFIKERAPEAEFMLSRV